jgi:threonine synthase
VIRGLAPDGGLYIPNQIPSLPPNWEQDWSEYTFQELSFAILSLYIPASEIPSDALKEIIQKSYSTFREPSVTPLHKINDQLHILELFHGPTFAFKDVALQFLGNLFEFFLLRRNAAAKKDNNLQEERITVLGATSGDTGSAAIYGLRSKANLSIVILHPYGRVSPIQEAQMTTVTDANVHNIAVHGTFDDCQDIVKTCFGDKEFNSKWKLGAINSINWARILAQMVYYFSAYFQAKTSGLLSGGKKIQFVVPTGNFGDVLAGYFAKRMGLPMLQLAIATNANDILARFWNSGRYEKGPVLETCSPAMDIVISSNFERVLWYLAHESVEGNKSEASSTVRGWMGQMKADGKVPIPTAVLELARKDFVAERVSDEEVSICHSQAFPFAYTRNRHWKQSRHFTSHRLLQWHRTLRIPIQQLLCMQPESLPLRTRKTLYRSSFPRLTPPNSQRLSPRLSQALPRSISRNRCYQKSSKVFSTYPGGSSRWRDRTQS